MKIDKGIITDVDPENVPEGAVIHAKNMVYSELYNSLVNEKGFNISNITVPYTKIGFIPSGDKLVIFSTDDINSVIGVYNKVTDTYEVKVDRTDLEFNKTNYITGEVRINYKGEIIVAFTDKTTKPKIVNLDTASLSDDYEDYLLFPTVKYPQISLEAITGGSLESGSYYVSIIYGQNDGTESNYSLVSQPISIVDDNISSGYNNFGGIKSGSPTSKSLRITLSNLDITYTKFKIVLIQKSNSITVVKLINTNYIINGDSKIVVITGSEAYTDGLLEDIIVNNPVYEKAKTITQLSDKLFLANTELEPEIKYQKWANKIKVNYTTELVDAKLLNSDNSNKISSDKGFMHGEVYSLYIRLLRNSGTKTASFHIPGRASISSDIINATTSELTDVLAYQVQDTTNKVSGGASTNMGFWQNQNERYPNTDEYNSFSIGGEDLRNKNIRHHRFPTILKCKIQHYGSELEYGIRKLDRLGIVLSGIEFPEEISSQIKGYEILYVKRDINNSTIIGQSLVMLSANPEINSPTNLQDIVWTTGGNWDLDTGKNNDKRLYIPNRTSQQISDWLHVRLHSFDMLYDKPSIQPDYIDNQLLLHINNVDDLYENGGGKILENDEDTSWVYALDYTESNNHGDVLVTFPGESEKIRSIENGKYIPSDAIIGNQRNLLAEECYIAKLKTDITSIIKTSFLARFDDPIGISMAEGEYTYLTSINKIRSDIYSPITDQILVSAGHFNKSNLNPSIQNGDVYISTPSFITTAPRDKDDDIGDDLRNKLAIHRRYICETVNNANYRYEDDTDAYTQFFPKSSPYFILDLNRDRPFTIAYSKDYTVVNDLNDAAAYDESIEVVNKNPNRILRSHKESRFSNTSSWRTFLNNDLYESVTDKGEIINIQGYGKDRLYIHHKNALYITRNKTTLKGSELDVTLGNADLFEFEPIEVQPDKHGYFGTQHDLSCILTPLGYLSVDGERGSIYIVNGEEGQVITTGVSIFLENNLNVTDKNIYIGNGIQTVWDSEYKRIILCVKNGSKSFTFSYTPGLKYWSSYHTYKPSGIISLRNGLYSSNGGDNKLYIHNKGPRGTYYNSVSPSFVDISINVSPDIRKILESINWRNNVIESNGNVLFDETFDYITIKTPYQTTGRIAIIPKTDDLVNNHNATIIKGTWSFNSVKNIAIDKKKFINDIFSDFSIIESSVDHNLPFYKESPIYHNFFIVRLEYMNLNNKKIVINNIGAIMRNSEI